VGELLYLDWVGVGDGLWGVLSFFQEESSEVMERKKVRNKSVRLQNILCHL